jgi:hypothetical protein
MVIAYTSISLGNGVLGISWNDIIAKSIPSWLRGRFFGTMQFATAIAVFGVGFVVRWMLGPRGPGFPTDYTILFTLMAVFLTVSIIGCWMVREPIRPVLDRPQRLREILGSALPLLRGHSGFRSLVLIAALGFGMSYAMPFYMVYAKKELGVEDQIAGRRPMDYRRSHEYGAWMIHSIETDTPRLVYGNVRNRGLIPNLPRQAVVEVPCHVDANGVTPCRVGAIPLPLAAVMAPHIHCHEMAIQGFLRKDRRLILQAIQADPMTGMVLTLPRIKEMVDELFEENKEYLRDWR